MVTYTATNPGPYPASIDVRAGGKPNQNEVCLSLQDVQQTESPHGLDVVSLQRTRWQLFQPATSLKCTESVAALHCQEGQHRTSLA